MLFSGRSFWKKPYSVIFKTNKGEIREIENDFVLAMTGYLPDFEFLKILELL
jgi:thioredoxin reductase (NADPH)